MQPDPAYITHRLLPKWVRQAAAQQHITMTSYSDDWVHRLERNGVVRFVHGYRFDLNASAAGYNANDKVAAALLLESAGLAVVSHTLLNAPPVTYPCVVKPLHGTGGNGVVRIDSLAAYQAWEQGTSSRQYAVSPLETIEAEYRALVLDGEVLLVYEKVCQGDDPLLLYNLGRGAAPVFVDSSQEINLGVIAASAMKVLNLRVAAVDIIRTHGGYKILEVNDGIMMEYFGRHSEENERIARDIYAKIVAAMF